MKVSDSAEYLTGNDTFLIFLGSSNVTLPPEAEIEIYEPEPWLVILLTFCYGLVSLVSVCGNCSVLWVVATSRRMQTVTNFFIANLAVADIIIGLFSVPFQFQAALLQYWGLPEFMCPLCPFVQVLSVNVSIFSLTAIALERYRAIMYPLKVKTTKFRSKIYIAFIWVLSSAAGVPVLLTLRVALTYDHSTGNYTKPFCKSVTLQPHLWGAYNHALVGAQYFVPLCVISYVYGRMALKLRGDPVAHAHGAQDISLLKNKRRVIKMLVVVVALFALCWLPYQAYNIFQDIFPKINEYKYVNLIWFAAHWLAMSNSCYNPFIYAIYNKQFRRVLKDRLRVLWCSSLVKHRYDRNNSTRRTLRTLHSTS